MGKRKVLHIYYDNPNKASDTYLKYLKTDCDKSNIDIKIFNNIGDWLDDVSKYELFLEPTKADIPIEWKDTPFNVDNPSATAEGIYNFITDNYADRNNIIAVIGRGKVGKPLIDKLINYGYTVIEFNSKSNAMDMYKICLEYANIIVGLSTEQIFDTDDCERLRKTGAVLIDSGNNFDTKIKCRCGKWTREVIINRILKGD